MRRWLIAVFALHFFVNVGAFAFGHTSLHMPIQGAGIHSDAAAGLGTPHPHSVDQANTMPEHGLTDAQPDLPDIIKPVVVVLDAPMAPPAPADVHIVTPSSPVLDGLQRPPRSTARFV